MTLVVLMGIERSGVLASRLVERGWSGGTPAAIIFDASTSRQQVWRGRLDDLAAGEPATGSDGPGTIVIGDVAGNVKSNCGATDKASDILYQIDHLPSSAQPLDKDQREQLRLLREKLKPRS